MVPPFCNPDDGSAYETRRDHSKALGLATPRSKSLGIQPQPPHGPKTQPPESTPESPERTARLQARGR